MIPELNDFVSIYVMQFFDTHPALGATVVDSYSVLMRDITRKV